MATGTELFNDAHDDTGVTVANLGFGSTDEYNAWALRNLNKSIRRFYYFLRSTLKNQRRYVTRELHTFRAFSEADYPGDQSDLQLFALEEDIIEIRVKYSNDAKDYVLCEGFDGATSKVSEREWALGGSEAEPRFTVEGIDVKIYPKPTEPVTDGIMLKKSSQVRLQASLGAQVTIIPVDLHDTLSLLLQQAIYKRVNKDDSVVLLEQQYREAIKSARSQFSNRKGDNISQPVERRLYT